MPAGTMEPGGGSGGSGDSGGGGSSRPRRNAGAGLRAYRGSIKLYDGRPTLRETFYQRALMYIREQSDEGTPGYEIADAALKSAGLVVIDPEAANNAIVSGIAEGMDVVDV